MDTTEIKTDEVVARRGLKLRKFSDDRLRLVRRGTNSVFTVDDLIIKVSKIDYDARLLQQQVNLMTWLSNRNFPVPRLRSDILNVDGYCVTIWDKIPSLGKPDYHDLGSLIRDFHELTNEYEGKIPEWNGFKNLEERLLIVDKDSRLTDEDKTVIRELYKMNRMELDAHEYVLKPGILHGDINISNVINDGSKVWLIDFDRLTYGPREWDLITPMLDTYLFEGDEQLWEDFSNSYGTNIRNLEVVGSLFELRALMAFTWLFTLPKESRVDREIKKRLKYFYTNEINQSYWKVL